MPVRHFGDQLLSRIGPAEVDVFMASRRAAVKTSTANRSLAVLKRILKLGVRWGHLRVNPAEGQRQERECNRREFFLDADQAARLLSEVPSWLRPIVIAALHTGARRGELLGLEWCDVNLARSEVTFRRTKNGEPRTVRLSVTLRRTHGLMVLAQDQEPTRCHSHCFSHRSVLRPRRVPLVSYWCRRGDSNSHLVAQTRS